MKTSRLQAFSYCPKCSNIRAIRGGTITYSRESTRIQGSCTVCGSAVNLVGRRYAGPRIGSDKRHLN